MTILSIRLLGTFQVLRDHATVDFRSNKERLLLAYLVVERGRPHQREALTALFWPEQGAVEAGANFRKTLHRLRVSLGDDGAEPYLLVTPGQVQFNPACFQASVGPQVQVDVDVFEQLMNQVKQHPHRRVEICRTCQAKLGQAVEIYGGDFLRGLSLPDTLEFEDWCVLRREGLHYQALAALESLAEHALRRSQWEQALGQARRLIALEPLREDAQRQIMLALYLSGQSMAALKQYHSCVKILRNELGVEPANETRMLFEQIRAGADLPERIRQSQHNLPEPTAPLVGRTVELEQISDLLTLLPHRLISLVGFGGMGKTRLALQAAIDNRYAFKDRVAWIELAPLNDPKMVPQTILATLSIPNRANRSPLDTLIDALVDKEALLVLDNCEHLIQSCAQVMDSLLRACPHLVILATSREPLRLPQEKSLLLSPLPVPDAGLKELDALRQNDAVRLFTQRVAAVHPSFELTPANANWVTLICQRLDGIPLALEMCAARARTFSMEQLAIRLDNRFYFLSEGSRVALPRQQTLLATVDWSYDLLSSDEQALLRCLSVFVGGWSLEAAEAVAGGCLHDEQTPNVCDSLAHLVDKSFVTVDFHLPKPRYTMLETIRQFANQKLTALGEDALARHNHRAYFLAQAANPALYEPGAWAVSQQMERDHDNFQAALADAIQCNDRENALRLGIGLGRFWELGGYWSEGQQWLERSLALPPGPLQGVDRLTQQALNVSSLLAQRQGHFDQARQWAQAALELAQGQGDGPAAIQSLNNLGHIAYNQGDYEQVRAVVLESIRQFDISAGADPGCLADAWRLWGNAAFNQANFIEARHSYEKSLAIYRQQDDQRNIAIMLNNLGLVNLYLGEIAQSQSNCQKGLALSEKINDQRSVAITRLSLGHIALNQNDLKQARSDYSASCLIFSNLGDLPLEAVVHFYIGMTALRGEFFEEAHLHFLKSLEQRRRLQSKQGIAEALHGLGHLAMAQGQFERAQALMKEALAARVELGDKLGIAFSLIYLARLTLQYLNPHQGDQAAVWLGATQGILDAVHGHLPPYDQQSYEIACQAGRKRMGPERFLAAWERGRSLNAAQAGELALALGEP